MPRFFRNVSGTSNDTCRCGSWLEHYKRYSGQSLLRCAVEGCGEWATDGAHVQQHPLNPFVDNTYILPFCHAHNMAPGWLQVPDSYSAIPARVPSCS
jgi:hypothetical protein